MVRVGILNESVTISESDGNVRIYIAFLEPAQISANISVEVEAATLSDSAIGKILYFTSLTTHVLFLPICFTPGGSDYNATRRNFTLQGGGREVYALDIPIIDDNIVENSERFQVMISSLSNDIILDPTVATILISDDDSMWLINAR